MAASLQPAGSPRSSPRLAALWRRLPAWLRAVIVGFALLQVGGAIPGALLLINLRTAPGLPWFLPATAIWLWLYWKYAKGWGWPRTTSDRRQSLLCARPLSPRGWFWALLAGGLAMIGTMGLVFVASRFGNLPETAYQPPFEVRGYPPFTIVAIFLAIAATAAVVEESAFRGYMQSMIEQRHGWFAGAGVVAVLFYAAHLGHAYATPAFVPFFLLYSLVHALLVRLTGSILPSVALHFAGDAVMVPMQYGVLPHPLEVRFVTHGGLTATFIAAAVPAYLRLAAVAREVANSSRTARPTSLAGPHET